MRLESDSSIFNVNQTKFLDSNSSEDLTFVGLVLLKSCLTPSYLEFQHRPIQNLGGVTNFPPSAVFDFYSLSTQDFAHTGRSTII